MSTEPTPGITLGTEMRRLREEARLTIKEAAQRTGMDRSTVGRIERMRVVPHRLTVITLLAAYGVGKDTAEEILALLAHARP